LKEDVLVVWLSFELLSGADIVQDKFLYVPRSERFVYDFSKGTSSIQPEEHTEFWSIFNLCFEGTKKDYSLQTIFPELHFIKPDGFFNKLTIENIVQGREKQKKEEQQTLKSKNNVTNSNNNNNNTENATTSPKRKLNEIQEEFAEKLQKKKKLFKSGSLVSKHDFEIVASFQKSEEERKEVTPDKMTSIQKTNSIDLTKKKCSFINSSKFCCRNRQCIHSI